jgi:hypothetical protein
MHKFVRWLAASRNVRFGANRVDPNVHDTFAWRDGGWIKAGAILRERLAPWRDPETTQGARLHLLRRGRDNGQRRGNSSNEKEEPCA